MSIFSTKIKIEFSIDAENIEKSFRKLMPTNVLFVGLPYSSKKLYYIAHLIRDPGKDIILPKEYNGIPIKIKTCGIRIATMTRLNPNIKK